ncbi:RluA family pseudouridine synthase [Paraglaciecola aquimarina]|uniref:RluA family pseudouridine synthase n=1 Tax=Paraglaciecola algarum TaxID=3050085 RepID=A0ABS9D7B3_9ALTE|nr:RluA family pseudouridine synthase [Paraglaciecola sp. G1-23]MCF2947902.1 RluA family pseudouridine synthase [Paraglaciecola sp. G1-23]
MPVFDDFVVPECLEKIETLFEDEHILLINKPSKLLSLSGKNPLNIDSVHYRLVPDYPEITLVHRLDFGTSGVLLLAKNKSVNAELTKQFQDRTVLKRYEAMLNGHLENSKGEIDLPISKDKANFPRLKVCRQTGKPAVSHFKVLERLNSPNRTRVEFTPITGRTHQLRIHSQGFGHPILGCDLYGSEHTLAMASRMLLHAIELKFLHPVTRNPMTIKSSCPF